MGVKPGGLAIDYALKSVGSAAMYGIPGHGACSRTSMTGHHIGNMRKDIVWALFERSLIVNSSRLGNFNGCDDRNPYRSYFLHYAGTSITAEMTHAHLMERKHIQSS